MKLSRSVQFLICIMIFTGSVQYLWAQENVSKIVNKCIKIHGGKFAENGRFAFDFRKYHYEYQRNNGSFIYSRQNMETGIKDVLTNQELKRFQNEKEIPLSDKDQRKYANSLNSVIYFAFLPYFLNDPAVNKEFIGEVELKGQKYFKIKVTFDREGGGDDFEDEYIYWINKKEYTLDFLAYSFHVDGGGVRFREAYNARTVGGVRFQDYVNYKHEKDTPVESLDAIFAEGQLIELSKIELENIEAKN